MLYTFYELNGVKLKFFLIFIRKTYTKWRSRWRNAWRKM